MRAFVWFRHRQKCL